MQIHTDARAAAALDYDISNYDRVIVVHADLTVLPGSTLTYAGRANIGGPNILINATFDVHVVAHELGHSYGLVHSGLWQVTDGNPISSNGYLVDTGDQFDVMGVVDTRFDFNPWYKYYLGWLDESQVQTVTSSGV